MAECSQNNADQLRSGLLPSQREAINKKAARHLKEVAYVRGCKKAKETRGAACWREPDSMKYIGVGKQFGTPGSWGFGENDAAAQWYCLTPSDGSNKGKHRTPQSSIALKVIVRVIHGLTILATITAPWVKRTQNPDFACTMVLQTFLELEKKVGRLPRRWSEHFDAGDGNWQNTTLLFYCYLVEMDIFDEVNIARHMTGHTHEKVDGWHVHLRAFMLGLLKSVTGAVVALPEQLRKAMTNDGPKSVWNRNSTRCMWAGHLNYAWKFAEFFQGKTTVQRDKFISSFKGRHSLNKIVETHEFWIFKTEIEGRKRTCFKYRTRQDLGLMSEGKLAPDFWRTPEAHPKGVPVFNKDADFSQFPKLGGFKENWFEGLKFQAAETFVRENNNFKNDSPWMSYFNPEWEASSTNAAEQVRQYWNEAPVTQEQFLQQLNGRVSFALPKKWTERDSDGRAYRGWRMENPIDASSNSSAGAANGENNGEVKEWRPREWDREGVQLVMHPAGGGYEAVTRETIKAAEKVQLKKYEAEQANAEAWRSDEPVCVGTFVYLVQHPSDIHGAFSQPLVLALVTAIERANGEADDGEEGSTNPDDQLLVQYCTASAYDRDYRVATKREEQSTARGSRGKGRKNRGRIVVWTGTVRREAVTIANVVTSKNKEGAGQSATAKKVMPFNAQSRTTFRVCGYTTRPLLRRHELAGENFPSCCDV